MTKHLLPLIAAVLLSSGLYAAEQSAIDLGNGTCLLVTVDSDQVTHAKLLKLVKLSDMPVPPDTPDPPAPVPSLTVKVRELLSQISYTGKEAHALAIAQMYESVGSQVGSGQIPTENAFATVFTLTNLLLEAGQAADHWAAFRSAVSDELASILQNGGLVTPGDYKRVFTEIAKGLTPAAEPSVSTKPRRHVMQLPLYALSGGGI